MSAAPTDPRLIRLASLVPGVVRRLLMTHEPDELRGWHRSVEVACIFADISGFTPLVEALAARRKEGLEQLRSVINRLYEALVATAERHGGEILRYAGDAMTVLFEHELGPGEALSVATTCGRALQESMAELLQRLPRGLPPLGLKVGVGAGPLTFALVGHPGMELAIDGLALKRAVAAEHSLRRGEIGVDLESMRSYGLTADPGDETRNAKVWIVGAGGEAGAVERIPVPIALPPLHRLSPFILEPLYRRIVAGSTDLLYEHRKLRVMFLRFDGIDPANPADLHRLDRYFAEAWGVVRRQGGFLTELDIGDKGSNLVGIFGAPVAIEAPWEAAGKSALEIVALSRRHGLSARAGLACGPVFCGEIGAGGRLQYTVFGEAINRSARLMGQSGVDQVLVDPTLMEELGAEFVVESLPPRQLKGFTGPVAIGRLVKRRDDLVASLSQPLLGRSFQLRRLEELWDSARQSRRKTIALKGPPGIGKSRLLQELTARVVRDGGLTLIARGEPDEQGVPLGRLRGVLESLLELHQSPGETSPPFPTSGADSQNHQAPSLVPRLLDLAPGGAIAAEGDAQVALQSALAVADGLLADQARRRPVALVIEDLQWLDRASLDFVQDQCLSPADRPMLLLLSARGELPIKSFEGEILELENWDETDVSNAALHFFGAELLDRDLDLLLIRRSQGNPMMLHELCRHLVESGQIEVSPYGQAYLTRPVGDDLPGSLEALMLARLDQLPADARRLLQVASCIGVDFEPALLSRAAGVGEVSISPLLEPALDLGLLLRKSPGLWSFREPLLRETIHGALSIADLRRIHGAAAHELAHAEPPAEPARLAYHYRLAAKKRPAFRSSCQAAEDAWRQGSISEALFHLNGAIDLIDSADLRAERRQLPDLLARRSETHFILGSVENAIADGRRMVRLGKRRSDQDLQAQGWLHQARASEHASHYDQAEAAALEALRLGVESDSETLVTKSLQELGKVDFQLGRATQALQRLETALVLAMKLRDGLSEASIYAQMGRLHVRSRNLDEAERDYERALSRFRRENQLNRQLRCLEGLSWVHLVSQRFDRCAELAAESLVLSRRIGSRMGEATALELLGNLSRAQNQVEAAEPHYRGAIAAYYRAGNFDGMASCTNNLAVLLHLRSRFDDAKGEYLAAIDLFTKTRNLNMLAVTVNNLGELYEDLKRLPDAEVEYTRGLEIARSLRNLTEETHALLGLGRVALNSGRRAEAEALLQACREVAETGGVREFLGTVNELLVGLTAKSGAESQTGAS